MGPCSTPPSSSILLAARAFWLLQCSTLQQIKQYNDSHPLTLISVLYLLYVIAGDWFPPLAVGGRWHARVVCSCDSTHSRLTCDGGLTPTSSNFQIREQQPTLRRRAKFRIRSLYAHYLRHGMYLLPRATMSFTLPSCSHLSCRWWLPWFQPAPSNLDGADWNQGSPSRQQEEEVTLFFCCMHDGIARQMTFHHAKNSHCLWW